ncbi:hypothetical protein L0Y49_02155, partial [bacterium]|nr:hypothetical protein [bacterium]
MNEHDELEELLLKYRKEDGTFKKGYLHSGDGKRILELSIALIPEWKNLEAKLGLKKGSIANLMAYHGVSKPKKVAFPGVAITQEGVSFGLLENGEDIFSYIFEDPGLLEKIPDTVPKTSPTAPFVVPTKSKDPTFGVINSPLIGSLRTEEAGYNLLRNALVVAELRGYDFVFLSGNIVYVDILRYSNLKPYRSKVSGLMPDPALLYYPESVRAERDVARLVADRKPVFLSFKHRLDHIMALMQGDFYIGGKPAFSGNILICFGKIEEALVIWQTNERVSIDVLRERQYAHARIRELSKMERNAETEEDAERIRKAIEDFRVYASLIKMMNVSDQYINLTSDVMQRYIVYKLESMIPNAKVVSVGDTYIQAGERLISVQTAGTEAAALSGTQAGAVRHQTLEETKGLRGRKLPDAIIVPGMNPIYKHLMVSYRLASRESENDDTHTAHIIQTPTLLDMRPYQNRKATILAQKDPITRLTSHADFDSGMVEVRWVSGFL